MMKRISLVATLVLVSMALAACGNKGGGGGGGEPGKENPAAKEIAYEQELMNLKQSEEALLGVGLKFAKNTAKVASPIDGKVRSWRWDKETFDAFKIKNKNVAIEMVVPALKNFVAVAQRFIENFSKPFTAKGADGSTETRQPDSALLEELKGKLELASDSVNGIEDKKQGQQGSAPQNSDQNSDQDSSAQPGKPSGDSSSTQPVPTPTEPMTPVEPVKSPAKPTKPANPVSKPDATKPAAKPAVAVNACRDLMAPLIQKKVLKCSIVGVAHGTNLKTSVESTFKVGKQSWKRGASSGSESTYTVLLGNHALRLFTIEVAPLAAQSDRLEQYKSTETCDATSLKISAQMKKEGKWASELTEVKRVGDTFRITVKQPQISLKLTCK